MLKMNPDVSSDGPVRRTVTNCPVCDTGLFVSEMTCPSCETRISGVFAAPVLARLAPEQQDFVVTFVRCRGVIRDVERALEVSYPTVRARLDGVARALETLSAPDAAPIATLPMPPTPPRRDAADAHRRRVLEQVQEGLLAPAEAAEALRRL